MAFRQRTQRYFGFEQIDTRLRVGLVGHWIGIGSGLTHRDWSGYNQDGTFKNGTTWWVGREGVEIATRYDGSNDSVDTANTATGDRLSAVGAALTIACWAYSFADTGAAQMFIIKPQAAASHTNPYFQYAIFYDNAAATFRMATDTTGLLYDPLVNTVAGGAMTFGTWFHLCGVYNGVNMRLFLNGVLVGTNARLGNIQETPTPLRLGANGGNTECLNGGISDARVYNRVLGDGEIALLSTRSNFPVLPSDRRHSVRPITATTFRSWIMYS